MNMYLHDRHMMMRRYGPTMPGLVRLDRALLYVRQRIMNLIKMIEVKDTKGLGDSVYAIHSLVRQMAPIFAMSGHEPMADRIMMITRNLSTRTPRKQGIDTLRSFLSEVDSYPMTDPGEEAEILRERLELAESAAESGDEAQTQHVDLSKENTVFVIMPFKPEFNDVWKGGIVRAAKAENFTPVRVDMINRSTNITDDIVESVQKCRLAIVDVTGNNANVMFELGFAVAKDKPNIIISQSVDFLPFDIRNIRTIVYANTWSGIEELKLKIQEFLSEYSRGGKRGGKKKASVAHRALPTARVGTPEGEG